jgi:EAL domain-containing protein (putative c-di-GMP-specific phosphodiesterase class I)
MDDQRGKDWMLSLVRGPETSSEANERDHLIEIIENRRINPFFQPILEFNSGDVYAYEVLSRCEEPFQNPAEMFVRARNWGLSWELENTSRLRT